MPHVSESSRLRAELIEALFGSPASRRLPPSTTADLHTTRAQQTMRPHDFDYANIVQQFIGIPAMLLDLEFYFAVTGLGFAEHLINFLLLPLKAVVCWRRLEARDIIALALITVCLTTYWLCGMYTTQLYSYLYHAVRRTSFIKLMMFFSILDVVDKVLSSFCLDTLEVLHECVAECYCGLGMCHRSPTPDVASTTASSNPDAVTSAQPIGSPNGELPAHSRWMLVGSAMAAAVGVSLHALALLLNVVTLNVAINADGSSLLALLVSNNFSELKSTVFKKYTPESLYGVCAADALERLQLLVFVLVLICVHMQEQFVSSALYDGLIILCVEVGIDLVKLRFVCRFNGISPTVFRSYAQLTMLDIASEKLLWRLPRLAVKTTVTASVASSADTQESGNGNTMAAGTEVSPRVITATTTSSSTTATLLESSLTALVAPCRGFTPKNVKRVGMNTVAYAALLLWSCGRVARHLLMHSPALLAVLLVAAMLVKLVLATVVTGIATRFVLTSLAVELPQWREEANVGEGGAESARRDHVRRSVVGRTVLRVSPLLGALLRVDRFDLQAGKAKKATQ